MLATNVPKPSCALWMLKIFAMETVYQYLPCHKLCVGEHPISLRCFVNSSTSISMRPAMEAELQVWWLRFPSAADTQLRERDLLYTVSPASATRKVPFLISQWMFVLQELCH
jgi:hypothetical protein